MFDKVICPYCNHGHDYHEIKSKIEDDLDHDFISVKCSNCSKYFQVEIEFKVHKPTYVKGTGSCTCNPSDWCGGKPSPVCNSFEPGDYGNCNICEHDEECHK